MAESLTFADMCLCVSLYSFSLFTPVIIRGIRPTVSSTELQLLTVPVCACAALAPPLIGQTCRPLSSA